MIGYVLSKDTVIYQNQATRDKWEITHEEYEVLDQDQAPFKVYYTATFYLPENLHKIKITQPFLNVIPQVLQGLLDEGEGKNMTVSEEVSVKDTYLPTMLTFKGNATAETYAELEKKRVILYKEIMTNVHKYNILGILPESLRQGIADGSISY